MKDTKRFFSSSQKKAALFTSNNLCGICRKPISVDDKINFHHLIPHSLGGKTEINNIQVVHESCNKKIGCHFSELSNLKIKLRKWQEKSLSLFLNKFYNLGNERWIKFTQSCEPASGKTASILSKFYILKLRDEVDFGIFIVPFQSIKPGWVRTAKKAFGLNILEDVSNLGVARWKGDPLSDISGICITYQQLLHLPEAYKLLISSNRSFVVLDEVHFLGETLKWGLMCADIFHNKAHIVSCSGTTFRTDNNKIFSLNYADSGQVITDISYSYLQGLRDGILRPINFTFLNGHQKWLEDDAEKTKSFKDSELSKSDKSRVLNTALKAADFRFIDKMILMMRRKIDWKQKQGFLDCKGLIFACDQNHARKIAKRVKLLTGEETLLALADTQVTAKELADFGDSNALFVVTVRRIGIGFSCPQICVIGWATNVRQEISFRQSIHRGTRMIPSLGSNIQTTEVILPADSTLKSFADTFEKDKVRFLNDISDKKKRGGSISKFSSFTPLSSQALLDDVVRINISNIKLENYKSEPIEISPETKKMMTYSDQHNKLSDECNKLVSQIVRLTGETHKKVHYRSYEEGGCKRKIFSSIQDMELKKNWLEQEFLKQKKYK